VSTCSIISGVRTAPGIKAAIRRNLPASPKIARDGDDKALDGARKRNWTVVTMKADWKQIFPSP
jgi:hypothetical protein